MEGDTAALHKQQQYSDPVQDTNITNRVSVAAFAYDVCRLLSRVYSRNEDRNSLAEHIA